MLRKRTHVIRVIGQFVAKAMLDSRIIDLSFNKIFLKLVLGEPVPLTIDSLRVRISGNFISCGTDLVTASGRGAGDVVVQGSRSRRGERPKREGVYVNSLSVSLH